MVSAGYEGDNDPYTNLRNERKRKSKNIQIDLQESITKVEELNKVIQEHKRLVSPKHKAPREKLKEQMVVCDIEVQPEISQVKKIEIIDSFEEEAEEIRGNLTIKEEEPTIYE